MGAESLRLEEPTAQEFRAVDGVRGRSSTRMTLPSSIFSFPSAGRPGIYPTAEFRGCRKCLLLRDYFSLDAQGVSQDTAQSGTWVLCTAEICQGVLKYFNTCTPGLATLGCAGSA